MLDRSQLKEELAFSLIGVLARILGATRSCTHLAGESPVVEDETSITT